LLVSLPFAARAYENEATLGLAVGYGGMPKADAPPRNGIDLAVSAGGGVGDAWNIQGLLTYNALPGDPALHVSTAGLETVYALDIVRFVPLIGFGLDGLLTVRDRSARGDFALHALAGFDFLINRRWLVGADARGYWVATNAHSPLDAFFVTAAARVGVRIDLR
jgi:hypothetical protein